jgi:hypothetical protein
MEKGVIARQMVARNDTQGHSATPLQFDPFQKKNGGERASKQELDLRGPSHIHNRRAPRVCQAMAVSERCKS